MTDSATASRFAEKVCVVTGAGAGGGIGSAIARRLAREGATVVVCDVDGAAAGKVASEITGEGGTAEVSQFNLADASACAQVVEDVVARHGHLDVLVNNAGVNRRGDLLALSEEDWEASFAVNVHPLFHLCRAALPHMASRGGGAIVNTASQ